MLIQILSLARSNSYILVPTGLQHFAPRKTTALL